MPRSEERVGPAQTPQDEAGGRPLRQGASSDPSSCAAGSEGSARLLSRGYGRPRAQGPGTGAGAREKSGFLAVIAAKPIRFITVFPYGAK